MEELLSLPTFYSGLYNFFAFIIIISVIVFIHEGGHYLVAKKCGVKIVTFSIGFGKEIYGWNDKSGTRWKVSAIPLGGYVQMFGDEDAASTPDNEHYQSMSAEEKKFTLNGQSLLARFAIVSAGPIANFILAIVLLTGFFYVEGRPHATSQIGSIIENGAAAEIGLKEGDLITDLNGTSIHRFSDLQGVVALHGGIEIPITYIRDGEEHRDFITPKLRETTDMFGNTVKMGMIGVGSGAIEYEELGLVDSVIGSVGETYNICARTMTALGQMVTGQRSPRELSGLIRITEYSGQAAKKGTRTVLWFMILLSINLGLINLFPIPMLDGGHLFFYIIEAVRGKPLSEKMQEVCFRFGFVVLIGLMVFALGNDIVHLAEKFNII